jgi:adenylate kinase family enzyme
MKPRVHIIGGPGSGKSYAALALSARLGVPAYDLDDLFWDPAAPTRSVKAQGAVRDQQLADIVAREGWIIEGVYYGWLAPSLAAADVIIALTPPVRVRHWRVLKRFVLRKLGLLPRKKWESLASLWRLLRWSHAYDLQHLNPARDAVRALGRKWVECHTLEEVSVATSNLALQRTGVRDARPGR